MHLRMLMEACVSEKDSCNTTLERYSEYFAWIGRMQVCDLGLKMKTVSCVRCMLNKPHKWVDKRWFSVSIPDKQESIDSLISAACWFMIWLCSVCLLQTLWVHTCWCWPFICCSCHYLHTKGLNPPHTGGGHDWHHEQYLLCNEGCVACGISTWTPDGSRTTHFRQQSNWSTWRSLHGMGHL